MKRHTLFNVLGVLVIASLALAACGTPATQTAAPTSPPADTAVPAPENPYATVPFAEPMVLDAGSCDYGGAVRSVEAVDEFTAVFTLCGPDPAFLSKMGFSVFGIYPQEWLEYVAGGMTEDRLRHPIGTGPYMVDEWVSGESVTFTANPSFWGEAPHAETLVFRWTTESAARTLELQAGTVDGIDNVGPDDFAVIEGDASLALIDRPALNTFYIGVANTFEPWDDVNVRKAIAMGIDRQRIVDTFYPAGSEPASHFTPCAIPNGCVGDEWYEFDAEAAKALLAEAGFPEGFATKLFYRDVVRGYLPEVARVAEDIQAQLLTNLNIDAEIVVMESGAFIEESTAGRLDGLYLLGWGADYPHVTNFLDFHFGEANPQFGTPHPEIYEVLVEAAQIADPADAEPLYIEANNAIKELVPMVAVAHGGSAAAYRADVTTPQASPLTEERFALSDPGGRDTFVWMQNAEPISLFCADETDGESLRGCTQIMEGLYAYAANSTELEPALAESCDPNEDLSVWTCHLRQGVTFHDGTPFDANDVVSTFTMGLDASSPLHQGNTNAWEYYAYLWVSLMNVPPG
ncbi:MAG: transporter substrate binding protein (Dipeptide) [Anaerolineales bacterium]|nr:transporter substrate binding protein (Dipeptide) [Anaerolineales bacterium]